MVLLPLSSGHYVETGPLYERRRRDLATLMIGLSSGRVMRSPLTTGNSRAHHRLPDGRSGTDPTVCVHARPEGTASPRRTPGGPPTCRPWTPRTRSLEVRVPASQCFLKTGQIFQPRGGGCRHVRGRGSANSGPSVSPPTRQSAHARRFTLHAFFGTSVCTWQAPAVCPDSTPLRSATGSAPHPRIKSSALRYLGRAREVHHQRLMNPQIGWHPHDLVDWMYLPLAAGYADHVVCENSHGHQLRHAETAVPTSGAQIHTTFRDLIAHLRVA